MNIVKIEPLSESVQVQVLRLFIDINTSADVDQIKQHLIHVSTEYMADMALYRDHVSIFCRRLVVFDMDSTLILQEVIDELAIESNVGDAVKAITEEAMQGHINFFESLKRRVALLKGTHMNALENVARRITPTPGVLSLCKVLRKLGFRLAVVSGGFTYFARRIKNYLHLNHAFANHLEIDDDGYLTGNVVGPVVTPERKVALMRMLAELDGCDVDQVIAVGDGANDIPLLVHAGMGIAFCAKKKVKENAQFHLNERNLFLMIYLLGISEKVALQLEREVDDGNEDY